MPKPKVAKLLAPTVPLALEVECADGTRKLELKLAWTMRAAITIETQLRAKGVDLNILQNPSALWNDMDCTMLAIAVWACAQQEHPEYADEQGFEVVSSFLTPGNLGKAATAVKDAFVESLPAESRDLVRKAEKAAGVGEEPAADPTPAPDQA